MPKEKWVWRWRWTTARRLRLRYFFGYPSRIYCPAGGRQARLNPPWKLPTGDLSAAAGYLAPQVGGLDTTMLSAAQREEMRQGNQAQLKQMEDRVPPAVVEALRPRAAELRTQDLELVATRLKGSGM